MQWLSFLPLDTVVRLERLRKRSNRKDSASEAESLSPPTYSVCIKSLRQLTFPGSKEALIITDRAREEFCFWLLLGRTDNRRDASDSADNQLRLDAMTAIGVLLDGLLHAHT